jgi:endonuclease/exonuclease/phosphatase family metal-dependent hydrolase
MLVAGLGVACFLVLLPSLLWNWSRKQGLKNDRALAGGICVALALSLLFRVLNSGMDITTWSYGQAAGWALAVVAALLMPRLSRLESEGVEPEEASGGFGRILALSLGLMSAVVLLYFVFLAANLVTRWTAANYQFVIFTLMLSLSAFGFLLTSRHARAVLRSPRFLLVWNILFVTALVLTIVRHQVALPSDIRAYPIGAPAVVPLGRVPLLILLLAWPVVLLDFIVFTQEIVALKPSNRVLTGSFTFASLYLALMIFAHIFTAIYDYVPLVGPYFRDKFWCVHLAAGMVLGLPVLSLRQTPSSDEPSRPFGSRGGWPWVVALAGLMGIVASIVTAARPAPPPEGKRSLRILSYNIQQGYSADGVKNFDGQLAVLREANADVIGLAESDTNRIAGGNCDVVRYYADGLDMYSYYGPSPVTGTFGVALLSRYPIHNATTFFLFSYGEGRHDSEQTAAAQAEIAVGGKTFTVVVTHLGNRGPIYQQQEILGRLNGKNNVVLMGDFNFRPGSDSYRVTTASLDDSWSVGFQGDPHAREVDPRHRIDHIFVTPGTHVRESRYLTGPQSDHPALLTEIAW